jgi:hypothetical protein
LSGIKLESPNCKNEEESVELPFEGQYVGHSCHILVGRDDDEMEDRHDIKFGLGPDSTVHQGCSASENSSMYPFCTSLPHQTDIKAS